MGDIQFNKVDIIVIGAGSLSRELISWIHFSNKKEKLNIIGFLDNDKKSLESFGINIPVIGIIDLSNIRETQSVIVAITNCEFKKTIFKEIISNNISVIEFVHNSSIIGLHTSYGIGLVLFPNVVVSCNVNIGDLVFINCGSQIGHDVTIGNFTSIMANVDIGGGVEIGDNVFIGSNAVILPNVKIPNNTIIGAGSVVIRSIKHAGSYFGNPVKRII